MYLHRYVIAEMGYHTLVSVKNNTRESRTVVSVVFLLWPQYVLINQKNFWVNKSEVFLDSHSYKPSALLSSVFFFLICLSVSNLDFLFAQGRSVDLCPQMTRLPLNSLLIFTQVQCSSVVRVRPIDLALNNGIILTD